MKETIIPNMAATFFVLLMFISIVFDFFTLTIPNLISILLVFVFCLLAVISPLSWQVFGQHLGCSFFVLAIAYLMWNAGWIGGGDAKLAASTALWLGWEHLLDYVFLTSIVGGMLAIAILCFRCLKLPTSFLSVSFIARLADKRNGVPYGIALGVAGIVVYPEAVLWSGFASSFLAP